MHHQLNLLVYLKFAPETFISINVYENTMDAVTVCENWSHREYNADLKYINNG